MKRGQLEVTKSAREGEMPDSSTLVEHLRLIHFTLLGFCLLVFLAVSAPNQSVFAQARSTAREILGLQPFLASRWDSAEELRYSNSSDQTWLRDLVRESYKNLLPKTPLRFVAQDRVTKARLGVTIPEPLGWFVRFAAPNLIPQKPLGNWTIAEWAKFWNAMHDAELLVREDLEQHPSVYGYVSSGSYPDQEKAGWRYLEIVPSEPEKEDREWTAFLTDTPDRENVFMASGSDDREKNLPYLDQTASSFKGKSEYEISVIKLGAAKKWIDIQGKLAAKAFARWPRGTFDFSFPELAEVTKNTTTLTLAELPGELERKGQAAGAAESLKVAGLELRLSTVGLWGGILLISLQLYFLLHLSALQSRLTPCDKAWRFPWIALYKSALSYAVCVLTICVTPIIVGMRLFIQIGVASCSEGLWLWKTLYYCAALCNAGLAIVTLMRLNQSFRPGKKSRRASSE